MLYTKEQVVNGLNNWVDEDFIGTMAFGPEDIENARRHIV